MYTDFYSKSNSTIFGKIKTFEQRIEMGIKLYVEHVSLRFLIDTANPSLRATKLHNLEP